MEIYVRDLTRWQRAVNLVGPKTLNDVWGRHVDDSLQLLDLAPPGLPWLDLGSGAGLPGLVLAAHDSAPKVTLVESDSRKCAFLRSTARAMGVEVSVREGRIETVVPGLAAGPWLVTARGLAPLTELLGYAEPLLMAGSIGIFPKGRGFEQELTVARESWRFAVDVRPSRTDSDGRILVITEFHGARSEP